MLTQRRPKLNLSRIMARHISRQSGTETNGRIWKLLSPERRLKDRRCAPRLLRLSSVIGHSRYLGRRDASYDGGGKTCPVQNYLLRLAVRPAGSTVRHGATRLTQPSSALCRQCLAVARQGQPFQDKWVIDRISAEKRAARRPAKRLKIVK